MGRISVGSKRWRLDRQINFTKGFATPGRDDSEAEQYTNIELARDGTLQGRLGSFLHNKNALNTNLIVGMGRASIIIGGTLVDVFIVAKKGTTWYYAGTPFTSAETYTTLTSLQDPGILPVRMEYATLTDETPIVLFGNENFSPGLMYWNGSTVNNIAAAPPHVRLIRQINQHTYIVTSDNPTRIYFSDESDPTAWPSTSFFDINPSRGVITGIERNAAMTLLIFTERSIQGLFGDPTNAQGFNVEILHDDIGCDTPQSVYTLGSSTIFAYRGSLYSFSGSVQELAEQLRGITRAASSPQNATTVMLMGGRISNGTQSYMQSYLIDNVTGAVSIGSAVQPFPYFDNSGTALDPSKNFLIGATADSTIHPYPGDVVSYLIDNVTGSLVSASVLSIDNTPFAQPFFTELNITSDGLNFYAINETTGFEIQINSVSVDTTNASLSLVSGSPTNIVPFVGQYGTVLITNTVLLVLNTINPGEVKVFSFLLVGGLATFVTSSLLLIADLQRGFFSHAVSASGRFVYALFPTSSQSIVLVLDVNTVTGTFSEVETVLIGGGSLSCIIIHPTGSFLYVAHGLNIDVFSINAITGALTFNQTYTGITGNYYLFNNTALTFDVTGNYLIITLSGPTLPGDKAVAVASINPIGGTLTAVAGSPFVSVSATVSAPCISSMLPNNQYLTVATTNDSGFSELLVYSFDDTTGELSFLTESISNTTTGPLFIMQFLQGNTTQKGIPFSAALFQSWGAMTPWHILYRPCLNTGTDGAPTTGFPCMTYAVDRERSGWWSVWNYPSVTSLGTSNPYQSAVFPLDNQFMLAGGDGQVYAQQVRQTDQKNIFGIFEPPVFTPDAPGFQVTSTYRSRLSEQGDPTLVKQCRSAAFMGTCDLASANVLFRWLGSDHQFRTFTPPAGQSASLPLEVNFNVSSIPMTNYYFMQVQISASSMWLKGYGINWRGVRWSGRGNLNV